MCWAPTHTLFHISGSPDWVVLASTATIQTDAFGHFFFNLLFLLVLQVRQMVFFQKIPSRGPNMSLAALVWRSTVVCLPTVAGELLHPTYLCDQVASHCAVCSLSILSFRIRHFTLYNFLTMVQG